MVDFSLYLVTDRHRTGGRPLREVIQAALRAGVRAIQLREKDLPTREMLALARDLVALARPYHAKILINGRVDVCLASGSAGVHLPATGLPVSVARALVGPDRLIGRSAHSADDAIRAETDGADFIVLGPIFDTPSKRAFGFPIGLHELAHTRMRCRTPIFGIGGITAERVQEVRQAGAHGVAVVGSLLEAADVERAARDVLDALGG